MLRISYRDMGNFNFIAYHLYQRIKRLFLSANGKSLCKMFQYTRLRLIIQIIQDALKINEPKVTMISELHMYSTLQSTIHCKWTISYLNETNVKNKLNNWFGCVPFGIGTICRSKIDFLNFVQIFYNIY